MLMDIIQELNDLVAHGKQYFALSATIVGSLWVVHIANVIIGGRLNVLGIYPRHPLGLPGIVCSPFLHASFEHLLFNSVPLLILINLLLSYEHQHFYSISLIMVVLSGLAIWLVGRPALYIGASHMVLAYWGFLLMRAIHHPTVSTVALALICLYYFAGMLTNIVPSEKGVSWEGHLIGLLAGMATVWVYPLFL